MQPELASKKNLASLRKTYTTYIHTLLGRRKASPNAEKQAQLAGYINQLFNIRHNEEWLGGENVTTETLGRAKAEYARIQRAANKINWRR
jgi:hypothetical protein